MKAVSDLTAKQEEMGKRQKVNLKLHGMQQWLLKTFLHRIMTVVQVAVMLTGALTR